MIERSTEPLQEGAEMVECAKCHGLAEVEKKGTVCEGCLYIFCDDCIEYHGWYEGRCFDCFGKEINDGI